MSIGIFVDKAKPPKNKDITASLGNAINNWNKIKLFMRQQYELRENWIFGGNKYGWNLWYKKGGKT